MGSTPNFTQGQVPTPAQWNSYFAGKQDDLGYTPVNSFGGVLLGKLTLAASTSTAASLNIPPGVAPSVPIDGDLWGVASGIFARISGSTVGPLIPATGGTMTGKFITVASVAAAAGFNIPQGATPSTPQNGDFWMSGSGVFARVGGTTVQLGTSISATFGGPFTTTGTAGTTLAFPSTNPQIYTFPAVSGTLPLLNGVVTSLGGGTGAFILGAGLTSLSGVLMANMYATNMINGTIVQSQGGNAQTFAIKTLANADPSAADPVQFLFRNATVATGNYVVRTVTSALSITIPSGQAVGFANATPGRVWIGALDNAGTVELFVINAVSQTAGVGTVTGIYPLQGWGIISTTAIATAPSAQVAYSTTARTNAAYVPIGYATWETGGTLGTAGTWNVAPTRMQLFQPGSTPLPGTPIQTQLNVTATAGTTTSATFVALTTGQTQAITPTSSANVIKAEGYGGLNLSVASIGITQISRGSVAATGLFGNNGFNNSSSGTAGGVAMVGYDLANTLSSQTYAVQGKTTAGTLTYPLASSGGNALMSLTELMG